MSILLLIALFPSFSLTVEAIPNKPVGTVEQRINALKQLFPNGSYFSGNGNACSSNHAVCTPPNGSSNDNCSLTRAMARIGYPNQQGNHEAWTCAAFARYAYFYVFGQPWDNTFNPPNCGTDGSPSSGRVLSVSEERRAGDIFVWSATPTNPPHWAMYLGNNQFLHSNADSGPNGERRTNRVSHGTGYNGTLNRVVRFNSAPARTVTFNHNYTGSPANFTRTTNTQGRLTATLPTPQERPGFTFNGWFTQQTGGHRVVAGTGNNTTLFTTNSTIWAQWSVNQTHQITFNSNGGSQIAAPNPRTTQLLNGAQRLANLPTAPTRTGYTFDDWFDTSNQTGGSRLTAGNNGTAFTSNAIYWARWVAPYTITMNTNGGNALNPSTRQTDANGRITTSLSAPTWSGHNFVGWFSSQTLNIEVITGTGSNATIFSAPSTIWARWSNTLTFRSNNNLNQSTTRTKNHNTAFTMINNPFSATNQTISLNPNGGSVSQTSISVPYVFRNWNTASNYSGTTYNSGAAYPASLNTNTTLHARWDEGNITSLPTPTRAGFTFNGWFTALTSGVQVRVGHSTASSTLFARWTPVIEDGVYRIKSMNSNNYMSVRGTAVGSLAEQAAFSSSSLAQRWRVTHEGNGHYSFAPMNAPDMRLDIHDFGNTNRTVVHIQPNRNNGAQRFGIIPNPDGSYRIMPSYSSTHVVDVYGAFTAPGTHLHLWEWVNEPQQHWEFIRIS